MTRSVAALPGSPAPVAAPEVAAVQTVTLLPTAMELGITCVFAVGFLTLAVSGFGKPE